MPGTDPGFADLGFARPDTGRLARTGFGEVVYCQGKTPAQTARIFETLHASQGGVLGTRAAPEHAAAVQALFPQARYSPEARCLAVGHAPPPPRPGTALIVCAGTSDLPVADEAAFTLEFLGHAAPRLNDCGVAGIHRLLASHSALEQADVIIVVAGMDGALPAVVGGLVPAPVIAVPTSVGYGAGFSGLAPLLTMLNACAPGVTVVNIDNGFGAALAAARILNLPRISP